MKKILAIIAISAVLPFTGIAQAQEFPGWSLSETCKPGDSSCARFEQFARGQISGTWNTLPPYARSVCLAETEKVEKSYRLLKDCLANAMQALLRSQHIKPDDGKVVHQTPMAKRPEPPAPAPAPAPIAPPAPPAEPVPQATPAPPQ